MKKTFLKEDFHRKKQNKFSDKFFCCIQTWILIALKPKPLIGRKLEKLLREAPGLRDYTSQVWLYLQSKIVVQVDF